MGILGGSSSDSELNLRLSLTDNATPGIKAAQTSLQSLGGASRDLSGDLNSFMAAAEAADNSISNISKEAIQGALHIYEWKASLNAAGQETTNLSSANQKGASSWQDLAKGVFAGYTAYNLVNTAVRDVIGFFKDSIDVSMKAADTMAILKINITNAGLSFSDLGPKIEASAKANERLGYTSIESEQSIGKLILITGDYSKAVLLNNLAMDLAANKGITLQQSTQYLAQIMEGQGGKALAQYGLSFRDGASSAEILWDLQKKVGGSAEALAGDPAGAVRTLNAEWVDMQKQVGDSLTPMIKEFIAELEQHLPEITALAQAVATVLEVVGGFILGIVKAAEDLGTLLGELSVSTNSYAANAKNLGKQFDAASGGMKVLTVDSNNVLGSFNKGTAGALSMDNAIAQMNGSSKKLAETHNGLAGSIGVAAAAAKSSLNPFDGMGFAGRAAATSAKNLATAHRDLAIEINKTAQIGVDELDRLKDAHVKAMQTSAKETLALNNQLTDLARRYQETAAAEQDAFNKSQSSDQKSFGEQVVAQEQKIADIKKRIAGGETIDSSGVNLKDQLKKEEDSYAANADMITALDAQVQAARVRSRETDFQKTVDDYKSKRAQALDDFNDKRARAQADYAARSAELQAQLVVVQQNAAAETAEYNKKVTEINALIQKANDERLAIQAKTHAQTLAMVDAEIQKYKELADAISRVASGKPGSVGSNPPPKKEFGGFVPGAMGQAVPIIAHGGEEIIPAGQSGKGGTTGGQINITINNPVVRSDDDIKRLTKQVEQVFRSVTLNNKISIS